ncbi:MAG: methyltransferase [Bacteroidales bacterium]|nr:methyltransferase [Bacteroidales bacterium]
MELQLENIGCSKDNMNSPIHNWYKFTAGFSYKFVDYLLSDLSQDSVVFEPFAGCGTTLVSAQKNGYYSVGNEGQEFMYDICRAKLNWTIHKEVVDQYISQIKNRVFSDFESYDISRENPLLIELYDDYNLKVLCIIRNYINSIADESYKLFFKLALSNVLHKTAIYPIAVPYISRSKRIINNGQPLEKFVSVCDKMTNDIVTQPAQYHQAHVFLHDSRKQNSLIETNSCSICITSPPYLNNLDYGEVSKVHSHFWGITQSWNDITTKVRSNLVTGATTHYKETDFDIERFTNSEFAKNNKEVMSDLLALYHRIKENAHGRSGKKSFHILMMHYFDDMYNVFHEIRRVLSPNSKAYLILGDSAPYGVYIPTTQILGEIATSTGFQNYSIYKIRTRGTKWRSLSNRHNIELSENILELS